MTVLTVSQVSLSVGGKRLFAPLDMQLLPGIVTAVTGPSGSGKSSLLAFLCGTLSANFDATGHVQLDDEDVTGMAPEMRRIGILFQEPYLFPHFSVRGNLLFGLRQAGSRRQRRQIVEASLVSVGLGGYGERDPATLSGGQKARVALLRVLLAEPRALLLDEPFSSLDDVSRDRIRSLVFEEIRKRKLPTLLVTHDSGDIVAAAGPVIPLSRA